LKDTLSGAGPFTLFAPTNAAFTGAPTLTDTQLPFVLKYHVLGSQVLSTGIPYGTAVATLNTNSLNGAVLAKGQTITINNNPLAIIDKTAVAAPHHQHRCAGQQWSDSCGQQGADSELMDRPGCGVNRIPSPKKRHSHLGRFFRNIYMCVARPPCPEHTGLCSAVPRCVPGCVRLCIPRYTPRHCGARFSLKASAASPKSSVISASTCTWFSRSRAEAKLGASKLLHITRLVCKVL